MLEMKSPIFQLSTVLLAYLNLDPLVDKKDALVLMKLVHHTALKKSIFLQAKKVVLRSFQREKKFTF